MTELKHIRAFWAVWWFAFLISMLVFWSCAGSVATPKDATQTVYAVGWTLVGATNSVADMHDSGALKGSDYTTAKDILKEAASAYKSGQTALAQGKPNDAVTYVRYAQTSLNKLAAYLAAKETK